MKRKVEQDDKQAEREQTADERHRGLNAAGDSPAGHQRPQPGPRQKIDPGDTPEVDWPFFPHVCPKARRSRPGGRVISGGYGLQLVCRPVRFPASSSNFSGHEKRIKTTGCPLGRNGGERFCSAETVAGLQGQKRPWQRQKHRPHLR